MVEEPHLEHVLVPTVSVEVLVAGHIVAECVVSLPATEQREARSQLNLNAVVQFTQGGGGDVANLVTVVDITGRGRQRSL